MLIINFDQAKTCGWAIIEAPDPDAAVQFLAGPKHVIAFGAAKGYRARLDVMAQLRLCMEERALTTSSIYAVFEDHSGVPASAGWPTAQVLGMGRAWGHWDEQLNFFDVPESHRSLVAPSTWRPAVLGIKASTGKEEAKRVAVQHVKACTGRSHVSHDAAEAFAIALWSGQNLPAKLAYERQLAQVAKKRRRSA